MKKLFLVAVAALISVFSANAQVKIESPHPDLDIKITRCAYANGTVIVDMVITNFGNDEKLRLGCNEVLAYDDEGNMYDGHLRSQTNTKVTMGLMSVKSLYTHSEALYPQDIPLKFRLQLENISSNASKFALLSMGFTSNGTMGLNGEKPIKVRNLEWVK